MDVQTIRFLSMYNASVNENMNSCISKLSTDTWNKNFGGYFPSIKSLCNHIFTGDSNWLKRFSALRSFKFTEGTNLIQRLDFSKDNIGDMSNYFEQRKLLDSKITEFADELTEEDLKKDLTYIDSHGVQYSKNTGYLVLHMFNHQTHHRGMVSLYLDELRISNDFSNIYDIL